MTPLILVTNDDGVRSPGLHALAAAMLPLGDVLIAAPLTQQTSMSRALTRGGDAGRIEAIPLSLDGRSLIAYGVHASPALAAAHGVLELAERVPDLCVSGINYGENLGLSLTRSGTLGAALELTSFSIPGIAVSLESDPEHHYATDYPPMDWDAAAWIAHEMAARVLAHGLPRGTHVLNINVPQGATRTTAIRWTHQSRHNYYEYIDQHERPHDQPYRLREDRITRADVEPTSDIYAFAVERAISITPLTANLTSPGYADPWLAAV